MRLLLGTAAALLLLPGPAAAADPAALDRGFGKGGVLVLEGEAATLAPGGTAVAVSRDAVDRIDRRGRVRRSTGIRFDAVHGVAAARGGAIAVAGVIDDQTVLARFRRDGSLRDRSLLAGTPYGLQMAADGTVYAATGGSVIARVTPEGRVEADWARLPGEVMRLALGPRGLLVAGAEDGGSDVHGDIQWRSFVARLTPEGALDGSFGAGGLVSTGDGLPGALAPWRSGALYAVAVCGLYQGVDDCREFGFSRLAPNGARAGFAYDRRPVGEITALAREPDGDVLAAGPAELHDRYGGFFVQRYRGRRLDRRFGRCGGVHGPAPRGAFVTQLAVQRSGRIVGLLTPQGRGTGPRLVALRGGDGRSGRCR